MNVTARLERVFAVILQETKLNPKLAERLEAALSNSEPPSASMPATIKREPKSRKREAALVDPLRILAGGDEADLRNEVAALTITQIRAIIVEYNLDPTGSSKGWKSLPKLRDLLIDRAAVRARKGESFE